MNTKQKLVEKISNKYLTDKPLVKEDGAAGPAMAAGNGGFSNSAPAQGPVAGYDPVMSFRKKFQKRVKRAAKKGLKMHAGPPPRAWAPIGDTV